MNNRQLYQYICRLYKFPLFAIVVLLTSWTANANVFLENIDKRRSQPETIKILESRLRRDLQGKRISEELFPPIFDRYLYHLRCQNNSLQAIQAGLGFIKEHFEQLPLATQEVIYTHFPRAQRQEMGLKAKFKPEIIEAVMQHRNGDYAGVLKTLGALPGGENERVYKAAKNLLAELNADPALNQQMIQVENFDYFKSLHYRTNESFKDKFEAALKIPSFPFKFQVQYMLLETALINRDRAEFDRRFAELEGSFPYFDGNGFWIRWLQALWVKGESQSPNIKGLKCLFTEGQFRETDIAYRYLIAKGPVDLKTLAKGYSDKSTVFQIIRKMESAAQK